LNIYLVRHGETAHNRDGIGLGRLDAPLTALGLAQAAAAGARLRNLQPQRVFSSPLARAAAVAGSIGVTVEFNDSLTEMDVGETEGLAFPVMRERFGPFLADWAGPTGHLVRMPGGESIEDVRERLVPLLAMVRSLDTEAVAVVSHNFVLRVALCELLELGVSAFRTFTVDLASVTCVSWNRGRASLAYLNDTCHLANLNVDRHSLSL
jgi:broad specificity phosphatase PhoE